MELTNQLHEVELNHVQANAVVAAAVLQNSSPPFNGSTTNGGTFSTANLTFQKSDTPPNKEEEENKENGGLQTSMGPLSLSQIVSACTAAKKFKTVNNNSGMSFDSGKMVFREFVEVGTQTNPKGPQSGPEVTPSRY